MQHFPRLELALAEMLRVLKSGGQVVVAIWGCQRDERWRSLLSLRDTFMPPEPEESGNPQPTRLS